MYINAVAHFGKIARSESVSIDSMKVPLEYSRTDRMRKNKARPADVNVKKTLGGVVDSVEGGKAFQGDLDRSELSNRQQYEV